ncbi:MAG: type II toxin-antitoxin system RelE/ParE family toxin [Desulfatiglandales bacterium]
MKFTVYAIELSDSHDLHSLEIDLLRSNPGEWARIAARLEHLADRGEIWDKRRYRHIGDKLLETKTPGGVRVIFFHDKGRVIICSTASYKEKRKRFVQTKKRAKKRREEYLRAKANNSLDYIIGS